MSPKTASSVRGIAALALLFVAAQPALGQQPTQTEQEKEHTVRKGDTLWDIARFYLNDPFRWPLIFEANRSVVEDPHWIYPLERLVIPGLRPVADSDVLLGTPVAVADVVEVASPTARSRFYGGQVQVDTARATLITSESATVPLVQALEWLAAPWITESETFATTGRIFRSADPRAESDRLVQLFHPRDKLFLSTAGSGVRKDDRLLVVRRTRNLRGVGWVIEPQGILQIDSVGGNTALATIVNQFGDLKVGDLTIPLPAVPTLPEERLTEVTGGPTGKVIEFLVDQPLYGTTELAFVNLGAQQGIALGDELVAYVPEHKPGMGSEVLPDQAVAKLRVIRVTNGTATVRVIRLSHAALEQGLQVRVARKAS